MNDVTRMYARIENRLSVARLRKQWRQSQPNLCYYCGVDLTPPRKGQIRRMPPAATIDHKTPLSRGGNDVPKNWVVCCEPCNKAKGKQTESEYRAAIGLVSPKAKPMKCKVCGCQTVNSIEFQKYGNACPKCVDTIKARVSP